MFGVCFTALAAASLIWKPSKVFNWPESKGRSTPANAAVNIPRLYRAVKTSLAHVQQGCPKKKKKNNNYKAQQTVINESSWCDNASVGGRYFFN